MPETFTNSLNIEVRPSRSYSRPVFGTTGTAITHRAEACHSWRVYQDGRLVDSFLTKKRAQLEARRIRAKARLMPDA